MKTTIRNTIYNEDCIRGMAGLPDSTVQMILTDPPYLVNYTDRSGRKVANDGHNDTKWIFPAFSEMFRVLENDSYAVVFFGWNEIDRFLWTWKKIGFRVVGNFTFVKQYASNAKSDKKHMEYKHESAYLLAKGYPKPNGILPSVLGFEYSGNSIHPTQKPVAQLKDLVGAFSKHGDIVLDPFMGSGSTAEACIRTGRDFLGYELDTKYYELSTQRLHQIQLNGFDDSTEAKQPEPEPEPRQVQSFQYVPQVVNQGGNYQVRG